MKTVPVCQDKGINRKVLIYFDLQYNAKYLERHFEGVSRVKNRKIWIDKIYHQRYAQHNHHGRNKSLLKQPDQTDKHGLSMHSASRSEERPPEALRFIKALEVPQAYNNS